MVSQSRQFYKHAVIALLHKAQSAASDVKYAFSASSEYGSYDKDRTSTFPALNIRRIEVLLYSG